MNIEKILAQVQIASSKVTQVDIFVSLEAALRNVINLPITLRIIEPEGRENIIGLAGKFRNSCKFYRAVLRTVTSVEGFSPTACCQCDAVNGGDDVKAEVGRLDRDRDSGSGQGPPPTGNVHFGSFIPIPGNVF